MPKSRESLIFIGWSMFPIETIVKFVGSVMSHIEWEEVYFCLFLCNSSQGKCLKLYDLWKRLAQDHGGSTRPTWQCGRNLEWPSRWLDDDKDRRTNQTLTSDTKWTNSRMTHHTNFRSWWCGNMKDVTH